MHKCVCVYLWRCVPRKILSYFCTSLCIVQRIRSPLPVDSEPSGQACLLNHAISQFWRCSNSTSFVLLEGRLRLDIMKTVHCWLGTLCLFYAIFFDGGMSGLTFPIWIVFSGRALLAGISNHRYGGWREAMLTCCIFRTPLYLAESMV